MYVLAGWWQLFSDSLVFLLLTQTLCSFCLSSLSFLPYLRHSPTAVSLPMFNWVSDGSEGRKEGDEKLRRGKDRVVLLVGKEGKQRGGDMRETDEKNEWRDERGR